MIRVLVLAFEKQASTHANQPPDLAGNDRHLLLEHSPRAASVPPSSLLRRMTGVDRLPPVNTGFQAEIRNGPTDPHSPVLPAETSSVIELSEMSQKSVDRTIPCPEMSHQVRGSSISRHMHHKCLVSACIYACHA